MLRILRRDGSVWAWLMAACLALPLMLGALQTSPTRAEIDFERALAASLCHAGDGQQAPLPDHGKPCPLCVLGCATCLPTVVLVAIVAMAPARVSDARPWPQRSRVMAWISVWPTDGIPRGPPAA